MTDRISRRDIFSTAAAATTTAAISPLMNNALDPIIALIAEEEHWRSLLIKAQAIAEAVTHDESHPAYDETHRLAEIAGELFDRIVETRATTMAGVIAKFEFLIVDPTQFVSSVLADLKRIGGMA